MEKGWLVTEEVKLKKLIEKKKKTW